MARKNLNDLLGFRRRGLAEPVMLGPIIAAIQAVPGVVYGEVEAFGGVPERVANSEGSRRLLTLDDAVLFFDVILGTKLTTEERADIVAYLYTL